MISSTTGSRFPRWPTNPQRQAQYMLTLHSLFKDSTDEQTKRQLIVEYQKKSRDNARTPMQWVASPNAGFTTAAKPWMRVNDNYTAINAASQVDDQNSVYHCYRQVLEMRKARKDIFVYGDYASVDDAHAKILAFKRTAGSGETALVVCNFSREEVEWDAGSPLKEVLLSPTGKSLLDIEKGQMILQPCEAIAVLLDA